MPIRRCDCQQSMQRTIPLLCFAFILAILHDFLSGPKPFSLNDSQERAKERNQHHHKVTSSIGMTLVHVPAGQFLMGAADRDELAREDEKPQHRVRISQSFNLGAYEVTVAQFWAFVKDTGFKTAAETDEQGASG